MEKISPDISRRVRGEVSRYQLRTPELAGKHYTERFENVITAYMNANRDREYNPALISLCAPFIYSMEKECDAYYCFERLMQAIGTLMTIYTHEILKLKIIIHIVDEYDTHSTIKEQVANFMTLFRYVLPDL